MPDLVIGPEQATDTERDAIDRVVAQHGGPAVVFDGDRVAIGGTQRTNERRHVLLPALRALQDAAGHISRGGLNHIAETLQVPPAEAHGVATFYHLLSQEDRGRDVAHVCDDIACRITGGQALRAELDAGAMTAVPSPCLGLCERAPAVYIQRAGNPDDAIAPATAVRVTSALSSAPEHPDPALSLPQAGQPQLRLLARAGVVDPADLDDYRRRGGYDSLRRAIDLGPGGVVAEVTAGGLSGRGGAAFPTGVKWGAVAAEPGPRHVIANADESEPGTFKDRVLMEHDPYALVEALTIAGFATGATKGWIYIRGEYPIATTRLTHAIESARSRGLLGTDVAGAGFEFDIELRSGGGAYICGEETALFNSIEGFRGEPRNKPPYPTTNGLFGQPTAVNNVETLVSVLEIMRLGAEGYRSEGTERSPGTKLFCLSGRVVNPGVYEVVFGATLREMIELAGGVIDDAEMRSVLLGGAAGSFVGPDMLDLPLTLEATREAGVSLGSGVIFVMDDTIDAVDTVHRIAEFFTDESCGQCVPCRVGTKRQQEALERLGVAANGQADVEHRLLADLAMVMTDASICGLGQTAASAVRSALDLGLLEAR